MVFRYAEKRGFNEEDKGFLDDFYTFSKAYFEVLIPRPAHYGKHPQHYVNEHGAWVQKRSGYALHNCLDFIAYVTNFRGNTPARGNI
jgi:hypothetical protein